MRLKTKIMNQNLREFTFFDHLDELRNRLIICVVSILVAACLFYLLIDEAFAQLLKPVGRLVFTAPGEAFTARMMLTFFGGLFLALPVVAYEIWGFVAVGLKEREIRHVRYFAPASFILFFLGALFAYFIAIPISMQFLLSFSSALIVPMITIKSYISFVD